MKPMEALVKELEISLDNFRAMQEAHKKAMGSSEACDLETLIFERSRAFEDLKEHLSSVLRSIREPDGGALHIAPSFQSRLVSILEAEQQLMEQTDEQRVRLAVQLEELAGLKRGLKGYAQSSSGGLRRSI